MLLVRRQDLPAVQAVEVASFPTPVEEPLRGVELGLGRFAAVGIDEGIEPLPPMTTDLGQGLRVHVLGVGHQEPLTGQELLIHEFRRCVSQRRLSPRGIQGGGDEVSRGGVHPGVLHRLCQHGQARRHSLGLVHGTRGHDIPSPLHPPLRLTPVDVQVFPEVVLRVAEGRFAGRDPEDLPAQVRHLEDPVDVPGQGGL